MLVRTLREEEFMGMKRKIKVIKIDVNKCNGCRACEVICSAFHSLPKYSTVNPARSRIVVHHDPLRNLYIPVIAGPHTPAECHGRNKYIIDGREHDECSFCGASCVSRGLFKEPDSGLPLKCDMCEDDPQLPEPKCVEWCFVDALTYEEREEDVEEERKIEELELGLEALIEKYGLKKVIDAVVKISNREF
jgi:benzoyl-CoA reductase subunit BamC